MLKLNLQMFAEGDEPGNDSTLDNEPGLSPSEQFDQMYYGTDDDQQDDDADNDTVNNDSGDVAGGDTDPADGDDDQQNQQNQQAQQQPWKNQQNADFAAQRRRQEEAMRQQAAVDAAYARIYAGQTNPYTGKPILTEADYNAYVQQHTMEQLKQADVDPGMFQNAVKSSPEVQRANAIIQQQQQMQEQIRQQQQAQQLQISLEAIKKFDKDVKTFDDIAKNPHFADIEKMWQKGYSLDDAYYLANRAEIEQKRQAAVKQQVINQTAGKKHLKTTGQNGAGNEVHVPAETLAIYREMMPNATDDEIRAHYARLNKK